MGEGSDPTLRILPGLKLLVKHWRYPFFSSLFGFGIFAAASLLIPPRFEATVTLVPMGSAERSGLLAQLTANYGALPLGGLGVGSIPPSYTEIVRSRTVLGALLLKRVPGTSGERLIDHIHQHGQTARREERALLQLRRNVNASTDRRTGILTIRAASTDPGLAAWMANSLDTLLAECVVRLTRQTASTRRAFLEARLEDTTRRLELAEIALRAFQERNLRIGNSPHLLMEESSLRRAVREQEEIYLMLRREYELARVDEHRESENLSLLDAAVPPIRKAWPPRLLIGLLGGVCGLASGAYLVILRSRTSPR